MVTATHFGCTVRDACAPPPVWSQQINMHEVNVAVLDACATSKGVRCLDHAQVGFYRGDVLLLLEDIEELQPTLFTSVPRLYNRIYDKVREDAASCSCALFVCHTNADVAPLPASSGAPPATRL